MTSKLENLVSVISSSSGSPLIYAYEKPSGVNCCVVYRLVSSEPYHSMTESLYEKSRIQLTCYGESLGESRKLAEDMKVLLDLNKTNFNLIFLVNDFVDKDLESGLFKSYLEFFIY